MAKAKPLRYDLKNDLYTILGVPATATAEEVQRAFRQRAKEVHPDLNPNRVEWATNEFRRLNEAYAVLGNPIRRAEYDQLRYPHQPQSTWSYNNTTGSANGSSGGGTGGTTGSYRSTYSNPMGGYNPRYAYSASRTRSRASRDAWSAKGYVKPRVGESVFLSWFIHRLFDGPFRRVVLIVLMVAILNFAFYVMFAPVLFAVSQPDPQLAVQLLSHPVDNSLANLMPSCEDPNMTLSSPAENQIIDDSPFPVRGTAAQSDFSGYTIQVELVDQPSDPSIKPVRWDLPRVIRVRHPSDSFLVERISLQNIPTGKYVMRLVLYHMDGSAYPPCERDIIHTH